jgi:hypothetical protein
MKEYLLYLLGDLTEVHSERYPESRYWKNNEYPVVLELEKSGNLWVRYTIWNSFSKFFSLKYDETQSVVKDVLEEHLKLGGITTGYCFSVPLQQLEEHLKLGGITTVPESIGITCELEEHLKLGGITTWRMMDIISPSLEEHLKLGGITTPLRKLNSVNCWKNI